MIEKDSWQNPESVRTSVLLINSFLRKTLDELRPDLIISELRKGSWIIDNYLQINGLNIVHKSSKSDLESSDFEGKRVMIFDDSVHTGSSIINIFNKVKGRCSVSICCIAVNNDAMKSFAEQGIDVEKDVHFLKCFDVYCDYESNRLTEDCQSYFYTFVMIPYIGWLTVNQSPDFTVCRALVESKGDISPAGIARIIYKALDIECEKYADVSSSRKASRFSMPLDDSVYRYVDLEDIEKEYAKLRISVAELYQSVSVTITPIISFMTSDDCDIDQLMYVPGERYLKDNEVRIKDALSKVGKLLRFDIVRGYEVGLPQEVDS